MPDSRAPSFNCSFWYNPAMGGSVPVPVVTQITQAELAYLPATIAAVQVAEASGAAGATKKQAVMNALGAGVSELAQSPDPKVATISILVELVWSVLNSTLFKHKATPV